MESQVRKNKKGNAQNDEMDDNLNLLLDTSWYGSKPSLDIQSVDDGWNGL